MGSVGSEVGSGPPWFWFTLKMVRLGSNQQHSSCNQTRVELSLTGAGQLPASCHPSGSSSAADLSQLVPSCSWAAAACGGEEVGKLGTAGQSINNSTAARLEFHCQDPADWASCSVRPVGSLASFPSAVWISHSTKWVVSSWGKHLCVSPNSPSRRTSNERGFGGLVMNVS